jgi:hypothetical protein
MGDRSGSFPGCAQVKTKGHRKDWGWFVGLVYDPKGLLGVTTARPRVDWVLQCSPKGWSGSGSSMNPGERRQTQVAGS